MRLAAESRMVSEVQHSLYNARHAITTGLQHGCEMQSDFAELFLALARAEAQAALLTMKIDALTRPAERAVR
ncbi:MAG: hypothetical protein ACREQZ_03635 [Woeseiaceae bacterium]